MKSKPQRARRCALILATAQTFAAAGYALEDASPPLPASRELVTVPSDLAAGATLNFVGVHGTAAPGAVGSVDSATATTVTVTIASKAPSLSLAGVAGTHYVRIDGKSYNITAVAGVGPFTFTVAGNPSASAVDGYVEVIARPTLNSVFGTTNKFGLDTDLVISGSDAFDVIFASKDGTVSQYKLVEFPGPSFAWNTLAGVTSGTVPLDPDGGFAIQRVSGSSAGLIPVAAIGNNTNHVLTLKPGVGFYSWPFPATVTLASSGLAAAMDEDNPLDGSDSFDVMILESGGVTTFIKRVGFPVNQWNTTAGVLVPATTPISAGSCFFLDRKIGVAATDLSIPLPITD